MLRRITVVLALVVPACVADPGGPATDVAKEAVKVCPAGPTVKGIDVSYYQGTIDWNEGARPTASSSRSSGPPTA